MKLFTKEILKNMPGLRETDGKKDTRVQVKLFNPVGAGTWYITEYDPETKDAFGFANLGDPQCAELGYIPIQELEEYRGPLGLGIERDIHFGNPLLSEVIEKVKSGKHC